MYKFPKKWVFASVIFHLMIAAAFYFTVIEKKPELELYNLDIRYIETPPPEQIDEAEAQPEEPEDIEESKEQPQEPETAVQPISLPPQLDLPVMTQPANPEGSMLYSPVLPDSLEIMYALIDSFINSRFAVPLNFAFHDALSDAAKNRKPTKRDTIRIIQEQLNILVSRALSETVQPDMLRRNDEKYTSKLYQGVMPVGVIIGMGAKLVNSLLSKAFSGYNKRKVDRFLDFDEISVMLVLWKLRQATAIEIDKGLPPGSDLRLNDVIEILEGLKEKLVVRLEGKPDEMSAGGTFKLDLRKNKVNPQFTMVYTPLISRLELVNFYDAVLADSVYAGREIPSAFSENLGSRNLREKIKLLTSEPFEFAR